MITWTQDLAPCGDTKLPLCVLVSVSRTPRGGVPPWVLSSTMSSLLQEFRALFLDFHLKCSGDPPRVYTAAVPSPLTCDGSATARLSLLTLLLPFLRALSVAQQRLTRVA